jgi:hypothetical protein
VIANFSDAGGAGNATVTEAAAIGSRVVISSIQNNNVATLPVTVTPGDNPSWCAWWPR